MEKKIDLHIHTNKSDGKLSPKEVIDEAVKNKVSIVAIADHDTIDAYSDELFNYAKEKNINLIPAVEISTKTKKCGIHVLGYNIDLNNEDFINDLFKLRNARHDYLHNVAEKISALGYIIDVENLDKIDAVTKAHIASNVVDNPLNEKILKERFGYIPNRGEYIETIMNEGCPAYVEKKTATPSLAAEMIRKAGGKVVLAHPVAYTYEDGLTEAEILSLVNEMKADGIEANYIYVQRRNNNKKIDDTKKWTKFADEHNLFTTVGSDFHQNDGIAPLIGLVNEELDLTNSYINQVLNNLNSN